MRYKTVAILTLLVIVGILVVGCGGPEEIVVERGSVKKQYGGNVNLTSGAVTTYTDDAGDVVSLHRIVDHQTGEMCYFPVVNGIPGGTVCMNARQIVREGD